jgi:hypothetical protein
MILPVYLLFLILYIKSILLYEFTHSFTVPHIYKDYLSTMVEDLAIEFLSLIIQTFGHFTLIKQIDIMQK